MRKTPGQRKSVLWTWLILILAGCQSTKLPPLNPDRPLAERRLVDFKQVQPLINSRCIACHSCMESPCQLNMQTWDGLRRGAFHENVYNGLRTKAVPPTRMYQDALSEQEWRQKGFADVLSGGDDSVLISTMRLSQIRKSPPETPARDSLICPLDKSMISTSRSQVSQLAMPYGLPPLSLGEQELLSDWVASGAPGQSDSALGVAHLLPQVQAQVKDWQNFLNSTDLKSRVVARYLFEHLFLAHLYFKEAPRDFLKLVRSSTSCDQGIHPLTTRRPNDDPGVNDWFYCFYQDPAVIVYKNHLPYEIGREKLKWIKDNFFAVDWKATHFPSFATEIASNPLLAFQEIPVQARHRFLLENAEYEVMTFIKGPVCNGSFAVNSIQEQFYVFFTDPKSELMARDPAYADKIAHELILPGSFGFDLSPSKIFSSYHEILENRKMARQALAAELIKYYPNGLGLENIWDGDGTNDNAVLTVFRHDDNAKVVKGAKGDAAKTAFVLDYSTFERLVYNLAINFDVFENVTHQVLTRLYMDILRMDAEDNFLQYLPLEDRLKVKAQWYQGLAANLKLDLLDEKQNVPIPTRIAFDLRTDVKIQLMRKILFERMSRTVRGPDDIINWKSLKQIVITNPIELLLSQIASRHADPKVSPFPNFFPELSLLTVRSADGELKTYSIILNREHENISWILDESGRRQPAEDSLTVLPGILGAYPNQFFAVDKANLPAMIDEILILRDKTQYETWFNKYGVKRMNPEVWSFYDNLNSTLQATQPIEFGLLDLSRYALER